MILTDEDVSRLYSVWAKTPGSSYADLIWAAESAVLRKLRERPADAWRIFDGEGGYDYRDELPGEESQKWSARYGRKWEPLHIIPAEVNE